MGSNEKTDENLLEELYRRDGDVVDDLYGSKQDLIAHLQSDESDSETVLMTVWAEGKWQEKSPGDEFEFDSEESVFAEFDRISENNFVVDDLQDDLYVVWTRKRVSRPKEENKTVRSYLDDDWSPLFARQKEPTLIEIRGAKRRRHQLNTEFAEEGTATKVQKEVSEESVLDDLSTIFGESLSSLDLIEIRFRQSRLPNGSQITLRNESGVQEDISDESINPEVISPEVASKIAYLKFRDHKSDNIAKVKVNRRGEGFSFEIQANYISDEETENIKEVIEEKFNLSFDKVYPYHLQHQTDFILHQILTGSTVAYDTYYEDLDEKDRALIADYVDYEDNSTFVCWQCREEFDEEPDNCEECGNDSFDTRSSVSIDDELIFEDVLETFKEFDTLIAGNDYNVKFEGLQAEQENIGTSDYVRTVFRRTQDTGRGGLEATQDYRYEYFVYPLSGHRPQRIGQYLFNTVFVTYGTGFEQELENFGAIPLTQLLRSDEPDQLFLEAVERSHRRRQDRYRGRAKKAIQNLRRLQSKVDTGVIGEYSSSDDSEAADEFLDEYTAKAFEKDIFHVLKSVFMFTERWGREGKKETDGCLIIPGEEDSYWVGGYDPKLTTDPKGYNIRSTEKDKVAYYILEETDRDYIQNTLKRGDPIDAHIFISDILREGQFSTTAERVKDWFSLTQDTDEKLDVPIVFLELESLLELYDIYDRNYTLLQEYPNVMSAFREEVVNQLSADGGYVEFDRNSCQEIRETVVRELDRRNKDRDVQEYSES